MGALSGFKVTHLASLGPGPYAAMLLSDMGCEVTIIDRIEPMMVSMPQEVDPRRRGQRSIALDLKSAEGRDIARKLIAQSDVLLEGMRPGVAERLGLGPEDCFPFNPGLVYSRVTGWGQSGPLAMRAGHDINYVALSGALLAMGDLDRPPPVPLNLLGDYAGGGAFAAMGILAALLERQRTGRGQVLDAAIVDGVASLTAATMGMRAAGLWGARGSNLFDGSVPWYRTYRTSDNAFVAVGALEPAFYGALLQGLGLDAVEWSRADKAQWPAIAKKLTDVFASQPRDHWQQIFASTDACVSPVLSFDEAVSNPHHRARATYVQIGKVPQPAPAPRLASTSADQIAEPPRPGAHTDMVLRELGLSEPDIANLRAQAYAL